MEFEQIKDYVPGDDVRNINWKASAKRGQLMLNQYQDEKSQPVYSVIDKGRVMKMPFEGMKLIDYAINATLVISNIALKKGDKAGMFGFSDRISNQVVAQKRASQMNLILETLYNVDTDFKESDFSRLYIDVKRKITNRSLLLLYTNFETLDALHRQLPYLQAIAKNHLLVIIFFENTELKEMLIEEVDTTREIFDKTIAEKFIYEKKLIVNELNKYGIQTILTEPQHLTVNTINKYLEIKARGLL
ncbi:cell division protein DivIC [Nonlabens ulvanivorans]|uniref:Cell division protein DivIC n=2 Tax=Nonlabens TaxID=363408 RepID=A0A081DAB5_NONUL|nr:cell division protein divIC [Nonlabens ulvanivorans]GAK90733.1 cell division protein DivIC [Nonlabens ulvanivorans]GAL00311.1 cell division protein DivIC [Nonlabens ulvanivorans]